MKQLVVELSGELKIVSEDDLKKWYPNKELKTLGEFIPISEQKNIGKKDVKGVDIRESDMVVHDGMSFHVIKYEEHKVPDGVIMGYFVPDGAEVLRKQKK